MWQGEAVEKDVGVLEGQAAVLAHAEQFRVAQQLTIEQMGQLVQQIRSRTKTAPKPHHQHVQVQAMHPAAAAAAVRRARRDPAAVMITRRSKSRFGGGEVQQRRRAVEQRVSR